MTGRSGKRWGIAVAVIAAFGMLTGCGTVPHPSPSATQLPSGITATLVQLDADVAHREAHVQIFNGAEDSLRVGEVLVEDPRFDGVARRVIDRESTVASGGTVDVRVELPPLDCAATEQGSTILEVQFGVGASESVARFETDSALGFLPGLFARECLTGALAETADVSIAAFTPAPAGEAAALEIVVEPTGSGKSSLDAVQPTPLLMYAVGGAPESRAIGLEIGPETGRTTAVIPLVPQQCDPQLVQSDERGTVFTMDVTVGEATGQVDIAADPEMRTRILGWVAEWCGLSAG